MKNFSGWSKVSTNVISVVIMFLCMASAAILRDGSFFCHKFMSDGHESDYAVAEIPVDVSVLKSDTVTINTTSLGEKIFGYGGHVPVEITLVKGRIDTIKPLENNETPRFFKKVIKRHLFDGLKGLTTGEALKVEIDAVSGATYSSQGLIDNVRAGLEHVVSVDGKSSDATPFAGHFPIKSIIGMVVVLMAAIVPLFTHNKAYRMVQQILNVGVLGFWCGTFVDYAMMLGYLSHGFNIVTALLPIMLLVVAFIYPVFGHSEHYCLWVCPLGSLQGLAGSVMHKKLKIGQTTLMVLTLFRRVLWSVLMLALWLGFWQSWIDYELFTAFIVSAAAPWLMAVAGAFILLSVFVNRPYCRFVCPTGVLLRKAQNVDND